jgi:hypothetical protein
MTMKTKMTRKIRNFLMCILIIPAASIAALPDISFSTNAWSETGGGITYDALNDVYTIEGNLGEYQTLTLVVNLPAGTSSIYLSGETWAEHITLGVKAWHTGKIKINGLPSQTVKNLPEGSEGIWTIESTGNTTGGITNVTLEFGMQNCTGTFKIKNPKLTATAPILTPYSFPYVIPTNPQCNINLVSSNKKAFNNDLLSFNNHFIFEKTLNWTSPEVISAINNYYPMTNYRFPGGTVGNHYNWTTDLVHDDAGSQAQMQWLIGIGRAYGYQGFKNQVLASSGTATLMFNVNSDDKTTSTNRLQSRVNDGLNVKWIELGNETFYSHQSHGSASGGLFHVSDVNAYINYTKDLTTALKGISSTTGIAVPINHDNYNPGGWSDKLSKETYFDATVMHLYVGTGDAILSYTGGLNLLNAYKRTRATIEKYKTHYGSKPTLFTEWLSIGPSGILTVLSNADVFMGLLEGDVQDDIVKVGAMHMFTGYTVAVEGGTLKHYSLGVMNAKFFEVFKGRDIFTALSSSDELATDLPGIISKAVDFGDSVKVFSVNKYPTPAELTVSYDGSTLTGNYRMETYSIADPLEKLIMYLDPRDAWVNTTGSGAKMLTGYSLTVTTIAKSNIVTSTDKNEFGSLNIYPNPASDHIFFDGVTMNEIFQVVDINGKEVVAGKVSSAGVNVSILSPGIYIIKVESEVRKITIQ